MIAHIKTIIGIPVQENLETYTTRSWDLIKNLKEIRFSGFLVVEFWQYEGYLIFDTGTIIHAFENDQDRESEGLEALIRIYTQLKKRDGSLSTYKVDPEWIPLVLVLLKSKTIKEEENLGMKDLKQFVEAALDQTEYGFIRIEYGDGDAVGHILMMQGRIAGTVLRSRDGKQSREIGTIRLFPIMIQMADTISTNIALESTDTLELYRESENAPEIIDLIRDSERIIELLHWFRMSLEPYASGPDIEKLIHDAWDTACRKHDISGISLEMETIRGLEKLTLTDLGSLLDALVETIKPDLDHYLEQNSYTDQLVRLFKRLHKGDFGALEINGAVTAETAE